ncbi:(S)-ureidoglycine aminohydrolase [Haloferula luteola]|uniref:(S)-ureidoglycine aminohydrolase n=1 Tax=Haloferula luteola TaxID=595692 RepID=A0A840V0K3_9BACT|nr:(S)-ureidoglycine aminohydrolase [Haloferula luteola]MBB5351532.1 (S)-ureidoglycine aminohydrolase [Haloferula luteola]
MNTRTSVQARHALIAPDGHVPSDFPHWSGVRTHVILSPAIGASLSQFLLLFEQPLATAFFPESDHEHAIYVEYGPVRAEWSGGSQELTSGGFLFTPAHTHLTLHGEPGARLTVFRKVFAAISGIPSPPVTHGNAADIPAEPFLGNPRALLQTLLPTDIHFDLAINIFTYQPGATLPFVETHIMEHGLLMLSGQGIYRLEDRYYHVQAGDAIWMAPYCPQWFAAIGDEPATYLYYKDIHRLP